MSDGYKIPVGIDLGDSLSGMDQLIISLEKAKAAGADTGTSIAKTNKEIVDSGNQANEVVQESVKASLEAKKAAEERAKAERVVAQAIQEVSKQQNEEIRLTERQQKILNDYKKNLDYAKDSLKKATDPTQVGMLNNEIKKLEANIQAVYERAKDKLPLFEGAGADELNHKLKLSGELIDKIIDQKISGFVDPKELDVLVEQLKDAKDEFEQLGIVIDFISEKTKSLDPTSEMFKSLSADIETANNLLGRTSDSVDVASLSFAELTDRLAYFKDQLISEKDISKIAELNKGIEETEDQLKRIDNAGKEGFDEFGNKLPKIVDDTKSVEAQVRLLVQQMAQMRLEGKENTAEYNALSKEASKLKNSIKSVNDEINKSASDTSNLDNLIRVTQSLAAGFAITQGAAALFGEENEEVQQSILKVASAISILQGLQQIQAELKQKDSLLTKAQASAQALYTVVVGQSTGALKIFRIALASTGIGLIVLAIGALIANWEKVTETVKENIPWLNNVGEAFDKVKQRVMGVINAFLQVSKTAFEVVRDLATLDFKGAIDNVRNFGKDTVQAYNEGVANEISRQGDKARKTLIEQQIKDFERQIKVARAAGEDTAELERALWSNKLALAQKGSEEYKDLVTDVEAWQAGADKKSAELAEANSKKAADAYKKELDRQKAYNAQFRDVLRKREDMQIEVMEDGLQKALEIERKRSGRAIEDIEGKLSGFSGTKDERAALEIEINKSIQLERENHAAKLIAIDIDYRNRENAIHREAELQLAVLRNEDEKAAVLSIAEKYSKMREEAIKENRLSVELEKALTEAKDREINETEQKFALEALKKDEDIALARIGALKLQGKNEEDVARLKEAMKLQVMLDAAQERLKLLKKTGGVENDLIIAQTGALITELQGKLQGIKPKAALDLFDVLGIKIGEEDKRQLLDSFDVLMGSISTIFESNLQRQIDAKDRQIDILSDQINKIERELDKELALQEKGYANNVEAKKVELEAISAERNKAQAEQEELQKRQAQLAAAQIALNGLIQASELALAAAKIFKAHAGIPFVGVITAIAAVATMVATFAAMKAKIAEASSTTPKFRHGGEFILDGPSHERGGLGVYDERTGKRVAEVEGGEGFLAINKESTRKHKGLLNAINKDDFKDFAKFSSSLDEILSHAGIALPQHEEISKVVVIAQQNADKKIEYNNAMLYFAQNAHILSDIAKSNKQMLEIEKGRGQVIDMGDYYIVKTGNVTRRIKKRNAV